MIFNISPTVPVLNGIESLVHESFSVILLGDDSNGRRR